MQVAYKPRFIRQLKGLEPRLREEAIEKIELFKDKKNHAALRVHTLHGPLKGFFSFSVNFKYRIVFYYESKNEAVLLSIGDHKIYDN
ncbi:MAG: type II toxin-antitoxin system RelE/ParE family toxin [Candidatus Adlerbacteria bacterium]|nr:type II toxin-antitoxin system RelE/ParE family toxin [Candidatus Adlerbacteria bacterium]